MAVVNPDGSIEGEAELVHVELVEAEPRKYHGRPTLYTPELFEDMCKQIEEGVTLTSLCKQEGYPSRRTFYDWLDRDDAREPSAQLGLSVRFALARKRGFDAIADDLLEIADDGRNDWMEKHDKDGKFIGYIINGEHVSRSKLRVWTRLQLLAKWDPGRYGEKVEHVNAPQAPLIVEHRHTMEPSEAYLKMIGKK